MPQAGVKYDLLMWSHVNLTGSLTEILKEGCLDVTASCGGHPWLCGINSELGVTDTGLRCGRCPRAALGHWTADDPDPDHAYVTLNCYFWVFPQVRSERFALRASNSKLRAFSYIFAEWPLSCGWNRVTWGNNFERHSGPRIMRKVLERV